MKRAGSASVFLGSLVSCVVVVATTACDCGRESSPRFDGASAPTKIVTSGAGEEEPSSTPAADSDESRTLGQPIVDWLTAHPEVRSFSTHAIWAERDDVVTLAVIDLASATHLCVHFEPAEGEATTRCIEDPRRLLHYGGRVPRFDKNLWVEGPTMTLRLVVAEREDPERLLFEEVVLPELTHRSLGQARAAQLRDPHPLVIYESRTLRDEEIRETELAPVTSVPPPPPRVFRPHPEASPGRPGWRYVADIREIDVEGGGAAVLMSRMNPRGEIEARLGVRADERWRFSAPFEIETSEVSSFSTTVVTVEPAGEVGAGAVALRYFRLSGGSHDWGAVQERRLFTRVGDSLEAGPILPVQRIDYIEVPRGPFPWVGVLTDVEASAGCVHITERQRFVVRMNRDGMPVGHRRYTGSLPEDFLQLGSFQLRDGRYHASDCGS